MKSVIRLSFSIVLGILCSLLTVQPAGADLAYEIGLSGGVTNNLFNDSSGLKDSYSTSQATLRFYPLSQMEARATTAYTYYSTNFELSNFSYSGGLTFIPARETSPVGTYLSAGYERVRYRQRFESFDNSNFLLSGSVGYRITSALRLRAGTKFTAARYVNADSVDADNERYELFAGVNIVAFGANSMDLETGFGGTNFSFISDTVSVINPMHPESHLQEGSFNSFYISPRFSRPLGPKTGVSVTYTYRRFSGADDAAVLGYATGFLSPWAAVYDGSWVSSQVKSYLIPHMIVSAGAGYWEKTYLKTLEQRINPAYGGLEWPAPGDAPQRRDFFTRAYLSVQRPISFGLAGLLEPTVTVEYSHNNSNLELYEYSETTVSLGLTFRK